MVSVVVESVVTHGGAKDVTTHRKGKDANAMVALSRSTESAELMFSSQSQAS